MIRNEFKVARLAFLAFSSAVLLASGAATLLLGTAAAAPQPSQGIVLVQAGGDRDVDGRAGDGADQDGPGAAQRRPDTDGPSEDGTDDEPDTVRPGQALPDQPPGCRFRNGPLELVV